VRQLLPEPVEQVVPATLVAADARPPHPTRPWLAVNMIAAADGATAAAGRSGALGGPADKEMFAALRGIADVVLVAAGTARAEDYGPARPRPDGRPGPRIAVVTRSGGLDPGARLFGGGAPIVVTCEACPPARRDALSAVAEVVVVGTSDVDLAAGLAALGERGADVVLCEGGPTLNGHLVAADLVDEWHLTTAPLLAGGTSKRAAVGPEPPGGLRRLRLDRLLEADGLLLARYLRDRSAPPA
jgi:riboflavin biosynthesis pyrimidine reductase